MQQQKGKYSVTSSATIILSALLSTFLFLSTSQPAQSQTYQVIHNFTAQGSDGSNPYGGPVLDEHGNLYGTTYAGGTYGSGSVYRLAPNGSSWTYSSLYSFKAGTDGVGPGFGSLAIGGDHIYFGTTEGGGNFGIAYAVCACPPRETIIHRFGNGTDGQEPIGGLVLDAAGNFYGTTLLGGTYGNGTVFEGKWNGHYWDESVIYSFNSATDAVNPAAAVTLDAHGNLYGTSSMGGVNSAGAIYKLTRSRNGSDWTESILYNFQNLDDGQNPVGGVIVDKAGNLYGTTFDGGTNGGGTVYELSPSNEGWTFTTLYSFVGIYGGPYNKLTFDANENLYGATNGDGANALGSVFKLTQSNGAWTFTDLYDFPGGNEGRTPYGSLAVDANGNIFGTASIGGTANQGVIFEITQ
jgi:uncharacterized repeat protein (TIGR03803 family)